MAAAGSLPRVLEGDRLRLFALLVGNGAAQALVMVGVALLARRAIDHVEAPAASVGPLLWIIGALCAAAVALLALRTGERAVGERLAQSYLTVTRLRLFDHLNMVPSRVLQRRTRGVMMVRFVADLNALAQWISLGLSRLAVASTTCAVALAALAVLSPVLAVGILAVLAVPAVLVVASGHLLYRRVRELRRRRGRLAGNLGEKLIPMSPVAVFGRMSGERDRLAKQSRQLGEAAVARTRLASLLRSVPDAVVPMAVAAVLTLTLLGADSDVAGIGPVLVAVLIVNLLGSPLRDLAQVFVYRQNYRAARDVLEGFLALPTLAPDAGARRRLRPGPGRLTFDRVEVPPWLTGISAEAAGGELVAVTGAGGSGKSTLLALAARLFDPQAGEVRLDGQPLRSCDLMGLRREIGMMAPELPLLRGSVRRSLTYRAPKADAEEIARVMALCGLEAAVAALAKGLDTRIAEGGVDLSMGLRQRLMLARAVLGGPRLLLIDDADAIVDAEARAALVRVLRQRATTTLLVTADPDLVRLADAVWHLEDGRLSEREPAPAATGGVVVPLAGARG